MIVRKPLLVVLCLAALAAAPTAARADTDFPAVIDAYLGGDAEAGRELSEGGLPAIAALEARILAEKPLEEQEIRQLVEQLNADTFAERERASRSLERAGDTVLPLLTSMRGSTESPEIRFRLDELLAKLQTHGYESALPSLLTRLYDSQMTEVGQQRLELLEADPHDPTALLFVKLAQQGAVKEIMREDEDYLRILYLLARLYVLHERAGIGGGLREFSGRQVIKIAADTYWPHELEPLSQQLGRWHATYAARLEGTKAEEVLTFDLEPRLRQAGEAEQEFDPENPPLRVGSCNSYILWIYLWRYEPPADGGPVDSKGAGIALGVLGPNQVRLNVVSHIAEEMPLPVVRMTDREKTFWLTGSALDWARPLIPPEYIGSIRFRQRSYEPAEILSTPE